MERFEIDFEYPKQSADARITNLKREFRSIQGLSPEQATQQLNAILQKINELERNKPAKDSPRFEKIHRFKAKVIAEKKNQQKKMVSGPPEIDSSKLKFLHEIATGGFGIVYLAELMGTYVAVKVPKNPYQLPPEKKLQFQKEVEMVRNIFHPNVVLVLGACTHPNLVIVFEFMKLSLLELVTQESIYHYSKKTFLERMKILQDIGKGLTWLHHLGYIHRDLKLENILLDDYGTAKIADFGLSIKQDFASTAAKAGNCMYRAPEVYKGLQCTTSSDVYGFGLMSFEIVSGKLWEFKFQGTPTETLDAYAKHILTGNRPDTSIIHSKALVSLMKECWDEEPDHRPQMVKVVQRMQRVVFEESFTAISSLPARKFWLSSFGEVTQVDTKLFMKVLSQFLSEEGDPHQQQEGGKRSKHGELDQNMQWLKIMIASRWSTEDPVTDIHPFISLETFNLVATVFPKFFIKGNIYPELSVVDETYFHGTINRQQAEERLSTKAPGTYLVRIGLTYPFVISCVNEKGLKEHLSISRLAANQFLINADDGPHHFSTIQEVVAFAKQKKYCQDPCSREVLPKEHGLESYKKAL